MEEVKVDLTDSEWMDLIDGERPEGLQKCCPNIAALRNRIIELARDGGEAHPFQIEELRRALGWVIEGHNIQGIPALVKLLAQIGFEKEPAHEPTRLPESLI